MPPQFTEPAKAGFFVWGAAMLLTAKSNTAAAERDLDALARRLPVPVAKAFNRTVRAIADVEREEMRAVFDRPTPWTLNSFDFEGATPQKLEASVFIRSEASRTSDATSPEYLSPEIYGGVRVEKRSEFLLRRFGILPNGYYITPGKGARLDAYGNISRGQMQQILSALRASDYVSGHSSDRPRVAKTARQKRQAAKFEVFAVNRNVRYSKRGGAPITQHLGFGVYQRVGRNITCILNFVRQPRYTGLLAFDRIARETAAELLPQFLREEIARATR